MNADEIRNILLKWKDVSFIPINVSKKDKSITYLAGTISCMYDELTDLIELKGLSYQNFVYQGKLEDLLSDYELWL